MALKPARAVRVTLGALGAVALLASCGSRADDPLLGVARGLSQGVFNRGAQEEVTFDVRALMTRALINDIARPLIFVEVTSTGDTATLLRDAVNGRDETWQVIDGASVTLTNNGMLRATRALGNDLYSTDIGDTEAAMRAGSRDLVNRVYVHIDGGLNSVQTRVGCVMSYAAPMALTIFGEPRRLTPVVEICRTAAGIQLFENRYWIDSAGFIWASDQWAGPEAGHLRIERLYR